MLTIFLTFLTRVAACTGESIATLLGYVMFVVHIIAYLLSSKAPSGTYAEWYE
jgi:hypothetical protein